MTTLTSGSRIAAPVSQRVPKAQPAVARMHRAKIERTSEGGSARIGAALGEVLAGDPVVMAGEARAQASRPDAAHGAGIVAAQAIEDAGEFLAAPEAVAREVGLVDAVAENRPLDETTPDPGKEAVPVIVVRVDVQRGIEVAHLLERAPPHQRGLEVDREAGEHVLHAQQTALAPTRDCRWDHVPR